MNVLNKWMPVLIVLKRTEDIEFAWFLEHHEKEIKRKTIKLL